jgi:hypothetical protein
MDSNDDLINALQTIQVVFNALQIRYFIGGSVASSYHGAMRSTMDVDIVADIELKHIPTILEAVAKEYYASDVAMRSAVQRRSAFNLIHLPTSFKVDIFVSRGRRFDESAFSRAASCQLGTPENCIDVPIASVEDILLAKLDWYRVGGEVSERQWSDVSRMMKLNRNNLDWQYLESTAEEIGVTDLLNRVRSI